ncbi:translocation/assembly module TamB domain-containing protein [Sulfurimonas sp.]|uniref:translocation/assembly module TamB domain-containing protein n=1 Tax=Sulfurimonas sp. TaxID=2022749 RepID=UPI001BC0699E|nr:translocation/assembly module TamB domain-containing protein [Sulfurimonas sp.]MBS4069165.1 translocation/assembly module TamB domain-containing protein [Sulfurimonas sp.]MDD3856316.1 translocation/assembly module TamB domain-containing protein [Sulfurimonas sp.]
MIKKIYLFFSNLSILLMLFGVVGFFILFGQDAILFLAQKYLSENAIKYKTVEGRLFDGIVIKELNYKDSIKIDEIRVSYNLLMLLNPTLGLKYLSADGVHVDIDKILQLQNQDSKIPIFALNISHVDLKRANIIYKEESYAFDFSGENLSIRDVLDIESVKLDLNSPYAKASITGKINSNRLIGKSTLVVDEKYLKFMDEKPKKLYADVDISAKNMHIKTSANKLTLKNIENLELKSADIELLYSFEDDFLTLLSKYSAFYENFEALVKQESLIRFNDTYELKLDVDITRDEHDLPFKSFVIKTKIDENGSRADFDAKDFIVKLHTKDYKNYSFKADTIYANMDGELELGKNLFSISGELYPKKDMPYYKELKLEKFPKLNLFLSKNQDVIKADLSRDLFSLALEKNKTYEIKGVAKVGSNSFYINGNLKTKEFKVDSNIDSLKTLISEVDLKLFDKELPFDAKLKASSLISYKDKLEITTKVDLSHYTLKLDSQNIYSGRDAFFEFFYTNDEIMLKRYRLEISNHKIESQKPSKITIDKDGNLLLREFWVYDNLLFSGKIIPSNMSADLRLKSDSFHYETKDINVTLSANLQLFIDGSGVQKVDGEITVLDATIMYAPQREYAIGDEDIIIIQDIKTQKKMANRDLNIRISSLKPIRYKIKEADITFTPNLTIYQELDGKMQLFGMLQVHDGKVKISDKVFEVDESEIYFYDGEYTNPHLNLNLHYYTLDNIDIEIFITNRLNSPVIIFASNPQMSQDDILSYILFGGTASSVFTTGSSTASLSSVLLGAGLKEMLNKSTNLKIDTLNILTNQDGTLGYEIGTRFSKKIRVMYKNNEISSVILQYSLNKSLRIDVDIKETGQGVSIYYMKDF